MEKNGHSACDEKLATLAKEGDTDALTELICRYLPQIRLKAGSYHTSLADRDDLIQEGLIGLLNAVRNYDSSKETLFRTFADVCIQNKMLTELEKRHNNKQQALQDYLPLEDLNTSSQAPVEEDPFHIVAQQEEHQLLKAKAKTLLSDLEQETLSLYLSGHSYEEMASILHLTTKAVDNALQRVRRKLRGA